jgi:tyrosyl-tRNA synthetase
MESGEGMAISEFSYPLFQAYDWWNMYHNKGVQLQIGGSDQYGNICAGMDAVSHMRKIRRLDSSVQEEEDPRLAAYGLTTPLLTTASGEKFGKSAGNAVWLDKTMMSSFDLYQYFMRTADADVERYLKLFTFLPLESITLLMGQQLKEPGKRAAQHVLAKEIVELAHGAAEAKKAETAHKEAFTYGTNTFSLGALRNALGIATPDRGAEKKLSKFDTELLEYKRAYAASSSIQPNSSTTSTSSQLKQDSIVTLPLSLLTPGSFPRVLHAAGLATSRSEAHRLIAKRGGYVVVPNSGSVDAPTALKWAPIETSSQTNPQHFLIDFDTLVLRSGKTKIQIVRIVSDEAFEKQGLAFPGSKSVSDGEAKLDAEAKDDINEEKGKSAVESEATAKTSTGEPVPFTPS